MQMELILGPRVIQLLVPQINEVYKYDYEIDEYFKVKANIYLSKKRTKLIKNKLNKNI